MEIYVKSSCVKSVRYVEDKNELYVTFTSGKTYMYPNCSKALYKELLNSSSKGHFMKEHFSGNNHVKIS